MYHAPVEMSKSISLKNRLTGAAAMEGRADAAMWVEQNIWRIVAAADWVEAWEYAEDTKTINHNPETGARTDVISDGMILARIQAIIAEGSTGI